MIQAAMVHKSYHPWSWSSTLSIVLNHGWLKSPYDSCTHSTVEPQFVQPISSFRQKDKKTKKETSKSCVGSKLDHEKKGVWVWGWSTRVAGASPSESGMKCLLWPFSPFRT